MSDKIMSDTYNRQIEKNYKWNFFWFTVDNMMFFFIFMGLSPYTVLPFYLKHFTDSNILIALIPAIHILGNSLPQIFMARFLKKTDERKKYLFIIASIQRLGIFGTLLLVVLQPIPHCYPLFYYIGDPDDCQRFLYPHLARFFRKIDPDSPGTALWSFQFLWGVDGIGHWLAAFLFIG
jgi:hypothetical protein